MSGFSAVGDVHKSRSDWSGVLFSLCEIYNCFMLIFCVFNCLKRPPANSDTLMDKADMDFGELSEILTNPEIDGFITRTPEGLYARV